MVQKGFSAIVLRYCSTLFNGAGLHGLRMVRAASEGRKNDNRRYRRNFCCRNCRKSRG